MRDQEIKPCHRSLEDTDRSDSGQGVRCAPVVLAFEALPNHPLFFWLTFKTQQQLNKAKGLIGYSLQAEQLARRFWTLSAWEDQQSLMLFVHELPHGKVMQTLAPHMAKTQFVQWKVKGTDIPLSWGAAKERMTVSRTIYY